VIEWNGSSWSTLGAHVTAQCHDPDVVVGGAEVSGVYLDDGDDLGAFCLGGECTGGSGIGSDGLRRVHDPRAGWAFGFPYAVYTQFQGAFAEDRLFLDPLFPGIDTFADPPETLGAFHCEGGSCYDPVVNPTVAGTSAIVFAAYELTQFGCVAVRWETGSPFEALRRSLGLFTIKGDPS